MVTGMSALIFLPSVSAIVLFLYGPEAFRKRDSKGTTSRCKKPRRVAMTVFNTFGALIYLPFLKSLQQKLQKWLVTQYGSRMGAIDCSIFR